MTIRSEGHWFLTDGDLDLAPVQIFCFTHAGGSPRHYLQWQSALGDGARLLAVVPPGRAQRSAEGPVTCVKEYADGAAQAIAAAADRPTVLLGHSLGALIAFEVARRLRNAPQVTDLVASGCAAPCRLPSPRVVAAARLDGREFAEAVGFFGGLPPEVVEAEELHDLLLPALRADFRLVADYRYRAEEPLAIRVHLANGSEDPHVRGEALRGWSDECRAAPIRHEMPGGHFYFEPDPEALIGLLRGVAAQAGLRVQLAEQHVELI